MWYSTEQMQVKTHSRAPLECAFITLEYFIRTRDYRFMYTRAHASFCARAFSTRGRVIARARTRNRILGWAIWITCVTSEVLRVRRKEALSLYQP